MGSNKVVPIPKKNRPKMRFLFAYLQNKVLLLRRKLSKIKNEIE